jgi:hypothetical protein
MTSSQIVNIRMPGWLCRKWVKVPGGRRLVELDIHFARQEAPARRVALHEANIDRNINFLLIALEAGWHMRHLDDSLP